jgi:hypothetical protein
MKSIIGNVSSKGSGSYKAGSDSSNNKLIYGAFAVLFFASMGGGYFAYGQFAGGSTTTATPTINTSSSQTKQVTEVDVATTNALSTLDGLFSDETTAFDLDDATLVGDFSTVATQVGTGLDESGY